MPIMSRLPSWRLISMAPAISSTPISCGIAVPNIASRANVASSALPNCQRSSRGDGTSSRLRPPTVRRPRQIKATVTKTQTSPNSAGTPQAAGEPPEIQAADLTDHDVLRVADQRRGGTRVGGPGKRYQVRPGIEPAPL